MTINFFLLFIHFFFLFFEWSTLGNVACRRWSFSFKHLFSYEDRFERVGFWFKRLFTSFVQRKGHDSEVFYLCQQGIGLWFKGLLIPFLLAREGYGSKSSREMGHFRSTCPKSLIKVISEYHDFRDLYFWSLKGFWQAWSCSKSWCIPNYQLSVLTKIYFFVCLTSEEFERVSKLRALWPIAWAGVIKRFIGFFKIVSLGALHILFKWFHSEIKCLLRWVHYQQ